MPYKEEPLSEEQISILRQWIKEGAQWGDHWAYLPPKPVDVPRSVKLSGFSVDVGDWAKNEIDYFILKKLEEEQLKPSVEADKATLIRRIYMDIIGLPPTPEQAKKFINDERADAYERAGRGYGRGVSDGLGILSSPFLSEESIQCRLLSFELRRMQELQDSGDTAAALELSTQCLQRFRGNITLQLAHAATLASHRQTDAARAYVRERLADANLQPAARCAWLLAQAQIELDAEEPSWLVLDLALQKALTDTPRAAGLLALKGASLVLRGRNDEGGQLLADAWRSNDGSARDSEMLVYLAIAAHRSGDQASAEHFRASFAAINRSRRLAERLATLAPH